jgi:hypothetical protein
VSLIDENVADIDFETRPDLVGITVLTVTAKRAYEIADTFRERGARVVLGGIHPPSCQKRQAIIATLWSSVKPRESGRI